LVPSWSLQSKAINALKNPTNAAVTSNFNS